VFLLKDPPLPDRQLNLSEKSHIPAFRPLPRQEKHSIINYLARAGFFASARAAFPRKFNPKGV
jgi:hypothetical protein